jgi:tight adherence protein B
MPAIGPLLAGGAAACGVGAAWSALGAVDHGLGQLLAAVGPDGLAARFIAPLHAGGETSRDERRRLMLVGAIALLAAGWLLVGPVAGVLLAAAAPLLGTRLLRAARRRRSERLADGAPLVARALADALGGGHSVRGALAEVARDGPGGPAGSELRRLAVELALGAAAEDALEHWRVRAGHAAYDAIVAAILLQRDSGGDLARLLRGLATSLEEHVRAEADARALTAQARFTAIVVAALPLLAGSLAELAHPGYLVSLLTRPLCAILMATSAMLQLLAWTAVRRIARLRR